MIITVRGDGSDTVVTLAGEGDLVIDPQPCPDEKREAQVSPLFRAVNAFARGRGNRAKSFQWRTLRDHDSDAAMLGFVFSHAALVPINIDLMQVSDDDGTVVAEYTQGVIQRVAPVEWYGTSSTFLYEIVVAA